MCTAGSAGEHPAGCSPKRIWRAVPTPPSPHNRGGRSHPCVTPSAERMRGGGTASPSALAAGDGAAPPPWIGRRQECHSPIGRYVTDGAIAGVSLRHGRRAGAHAAPTLHQPPSVHGGGGGRSAPQVAPAGVKQPLCLHLPTDLWITARGEGELDSHGPPAIDSTEYWKVRKSRFDSSSVDPRQPACWRPWPAIGLSRLMSSAVWPMSPGVADGPAHSSSEPTWRLARSGDLGSRHVSLAWRGRARNLPPPRERGLNLVCTFSPPHALYGRPQARTRTIGRERWRTPYRYYLHIRSGVFYWSASVDGTTAAALGTVRPPQERRHCHCPRATPVPLPMSDATASAQGVGSHEKRGRRGVATLVAWRAAVKRASYGPYACPLGGHPVV